MIIDVDGVGYECSEFTNKYRHWVFDYAHDLALNYIPPDLSFVEWIEERKGWRHIKSKTFQLVK